MERLPFDGLGLDLNSNSGLPDTSGHLSWKVWGAKALRRDDYAEAIEALKGTGFERFTDNFLRFNVTPGQVDWYDPEFSAVLANARLAAQIAKECGLKGLLLDVEHYGGKPFYYPGRPHKKQYGFAAYHGQVRQRGREFMATLQEAYPGLTILLTYGYDLVFRTAGLFASLESAEYGLLGPFLDGMLDATGPETLIFDGWESSYGYKQESEFQKAYETMVTKGPRVPQSRIAFAGTTGRASAYGWTTAARSGTGRM